ncbi:MAG: pyocin knob domain-containing protein, partial [Citrobacter portucalensis]
KGALLQNSSADVLWLNLNDDNKNDPATGTGWVPVIRYGKTTVALTAANVTLTAEQAAKETIVLTGALTANVSLIMPAWVETWLIINNTTGNFTVSVKTASGSGVNLSAGATSQIYGDGTSIYYGALMVRNNLAEIKAAGTNSQKEARNNIAAVGSVNSKLPVNGNVQLLAGDILSEVSHINSTGGYDLNGFTSAGIQSVDSDEVAASESNSNFPVPLAGTLVVLEGLAGVFQFYYVRDSSEIYTRASGPVSRLASGERYASNWTPWAIHYTSENNPAAWDTGALPLYPTPLTVDLNTLGATESAGVYCQQADASALPELNYPIAQSGTLLVTPSAYGCQQEYTTFSSGRKFVRGLTTGFDGVSGPWGPWYQYFGDSNAPPYPVTSVNGMTGDVVIPAPDLSGYQIANTAALGGNGWHKDTNTGLITQWGYVGGAGDLAFYFPIAFPSACVSVQIMNINASLLNSVPVVTGYNTTSVSFKVDTNTDASFVFVQGY